jgi:putative heme iron utilization protein
MNAGQADANLMGVKFYGHLWRATTARVVALDQDSVDLKVTLPDEDRQVRITFEHRLQDDADAQRTLVALACHAQEVRTPQWSDGGPLRLYLC